MFKVGFTFETNSSLINPIDDSSGCPWQNERYPGCVKQLKSVRVVPRACVENTQESSEACSLYV